jgi:hypothetical protein
MTNVHELLLATTRLPEAALVVAECHVDASRGPTRPPVSASILL